MQLCTGTIIVTDLIKLTDVGFKFPQRKNESNVSPPADSFCPSVHIISIIDIICTVLFETSPIIKT